MEVGHSKQKGPTHHWTSLRWCNNTVRTLVHWRRRVVPATLTWGAAREQSSWSSSSKPSWEVFSQGMEVAKLKAGRHGDQQ